MKQLGTVRADIITPEGIAELRLAFPNESMLVSL